jgi:hypothetical protein
MQQKLRQIYITYRFPFALFDLSRWKTVITHVLFHRDVPIRPSILGQYQNLGLLLDNSLESLWL